MASITTRAGKGSALTNAEVDANFTNINTELGQKLVSSDLTPYLLSATASATYQTIAGMSSYLTSASASSTFLALAGGTLTGNLGFNGSGLRITGDFTNATVSSRLMVQTSTANSGTFVGVIPSGSATNAQLQVFNSSDPANSSYGALVAGSAQVRILSGAVGTGTLHPITFIFNSTEVGRFATTGNFLIGTTTDNAIDKLQVAGTASFTGDLSVTSTGAVRVSSGTTAQRPATPANGMLRYNSSTSQFEGYAAGAWGAIAGSGGGGGTLGQILETAATITSNYTIQAGNNGFSVGPVTIQSGVSVTVPAGRSWLVAQTTTPSGITSGRAVAMAIVFGA